MNEIYQHMNPIPQPETEHDRFFQSAGLPFDRLKEEVWESLSGELTEKPPARVVRFRPSRLLTAAAIVLLLGTFLVMRYYSVTLTSGHGEYQSALLPDGSGVELNAGSRLSYHPLWWRFSRLVSFEGEGYFEVARGKTFQVESKRGTTEVLGTSFTIYARSDEYRVTCFTGAVKVISGTAQHAILSPDYQARIDAGGNIIVTRETMPENVNGWISGMFSFIAHPLRLVLEEIERQYDVRIIFQTNEEYLYTGHFSRDKSVEEALGLICKPFGLNFALRSDRAYEILPK
jgi:ferric-dicitrate binding protein FerR (iron transport regulator)